jgi:diphthine-ammonia ligase
LKKKHDKKIAACWSNGKDSCLALNKLLQENRNVVSLVSMMNKRDVRTHSHGIKLKILESQAEALGIPLLLVDSDGDYEKALVNA